MRSGLPAVLCLAVPLSIAAAQSAKSIPLSTPSQDSRTTTRTPSLPSEPNCRGLSNEPVSKIDLNTCSVGSRIISSTPEPANHSLETVTPAGVIALLNAGEPPRLGATNSPATIVVFGDFECAFCRRVSDFLETEILPQHKGEVSLVYRFFPLPQHAWARDAARIAACVQLQSPSQFWKLSHFLYANQDRFSQASLRPEVMTFMAGSGEVDPTILSHCVDTGATIAEVDADIQLGALLGINTTPTVFVNGERLFGVHETRQLEKALSAALKENNATVQKAEASNQ